MLIVFHSNFMNHHQWGLCDAFKRMGCDIKFIAHQNISEERIRLGYPMYLDDIILSASNQNKQEIYDLTMQADIAIFGTKPLPLYHDRIHSGKITFNFSERLFKKGRIRAFLPPWRTSLKKKYLPNKSNAPYVLCAGSYVAKDYQLLGYPKNRFLKWGYFPKTTDKPFHSIRKEKNSIIWVARFLKLKHPEYVIGLAKFLETKNIDFQIKMIGDGELFSKIEKEIRKKGLEKRIQLTGAMPAEQVQKEFETASIALMTSDQNEGWGAVVNEAMTFGCVPVVCRQVGSASYLIQDGINGLLFDTGDLHTFYSTVYNLLRTPDQCEIIRERAYRTIHELWNYDVAAKRLIDFVKTPSSVFQDGPLSKG